MDARLARKWVYALYAHNNHILTLTLTSLHAHNLNMEKIVSRPKNEDIGKALRDKRVPVMMSDDEWALLDGAAQKDGVGVSTFLRLRGLEAAHRTTAPQDGGE